MMIDMNESVEGIRRALNIIVVILLGIVAINLVGQCEAEAVEDDPNLTDCGPWVNCNPNPPSYNGICCRTCFFKDLGHREWDCAVHSEKDAGFSQEVKNKMAKRILYDAIDPKLRNFFIVKLNVSGE